ncbi:MAG: hypothetical protein ACYS8W_02260 [Planctomycetota bacterium]|jgi:hypothetical protein
MVCPIIDSGKPQCSKTLKLENLDLAFAQCGNSFQDCPIYLRHFQEKTLARASQRAKRLLRSA